MPVIPAFKRLNQEDREFRVHLGYLTRLCIGKDNKREGAKRGGRKQNAYFNDLFLLFMCVCVHSK